jgi:hypothetical protein
VDKPLPAVRDRRYRNGSPVAAIMPLM